jgi:hypothetical protein
MVGDKQLAEEIFATLAGLARLPFLVIQSASAASWRAFVSYHAETWKLIPATIESVNVTVRRTCLTRALILEFADAELAYSFEISGERFSGYARRLFFDEQTAWTYADQWKGRHVMVRCDQNNPTRSTLRTKDQFGALFVGA